MLHLLQQGTECCHVPFLQQTLLLGLHQEVAQRIPTILPALSDELARKLISRMPFCRGNYRGHWHFAIERRRTVKVEEGAVHVAWHCFELLLQYMQASHMQWLRNVRRGAQKPSVREVAGCLPKTRWFHQAGIFMSDKATAGAEWACQRDIACDRESDQSQRGEK